jgi:uncharacterized iron-regulated membrane protein
VLHRFWSQHDVPGVWFELLCGIALWAALITGLARYVRLLDERWETERYGLFWRGGGLWRAAHRLISLAAALFLVAIAFSGTWLGFDGLWRSFNLPSVNAVSAPLSDFDVQEMAKVTLEGLHAMQPAATVKVLRLRNYGAMKQGVVVTGGSEFRQRVFNADSGLPVGLTAAGYPDSGYPLGMQMHENMRRLHSGALLGIPARLVDLLTGLALVFLSLSGVVLYRSRSEP